MDNQNNTNIDNDQTSVPTPKEVSEETNTNNLNQNSSTLTSNEPAYHKVIEEQANNASNPSIVRAVNSDELLRAYIGPNYDKFMTRPFNFAAFFFTCFYYFYRKMILGGIILTIIEGLMIRYFFDKLYLLLIIHLFCGVLTNRIYVKHAFRKINKLLKNNPLYNADEIKGMLYVIGGRKIRRVIVFILSILPTIMYSLLLATIIMFSAQLFTFLKEIDFSSIDFSNININNIKNLLNNEEIEKDNYQGMIISDYNIKVKDEFEIEIPDVFIKISLFDNDEIDYNYKSNTKHLGNCSFELKAVAGFTNSKILIDQMHEYYKDKKPTNIKEVVINNMKWYSFSYEDDNENVYYQVCDKNNKVFYYRYTNQKESSKLCELYSDSILKSIKAK